MLSSRIVEDLIDKYLGRFGAALTVERREKAASIIQALAEKKRKEIQDNSFPRLRRDELDKRVVEAVEAVLIYLNLKQLVDEIEKEAGKIVP